MAVQRKQARQATEVHDESKPTVDTETRQLHPREILRQVANSMNWKHNELSVTIPAHTSWKAAIRAAEDALGDIDKSIVLMPPGSHNRQLLRQIALENVGRLDESSRQTPVGLPIRSSVNLKAVTFPAPQSQKTRAFLREAAKESAQEGFRMPYVSLRAGLLEGCLPMVTANVVIRGVDCEDGDPIDELNEMDMIWDTGAHRTIVTEEILSPAFKEHLKAPVHDPYRSTDGLTLQVDVTIALSNSLVFISAIAVVVPASKMPNQWVGILFGQRQCIDRIIYQSIPRAMLQAKGEDIAENIWGDIFATEYLNSEGEIVSL